MTPSAFGFHLNRSPLPCRSPAENPRFSASIEVAYRIYSPNYAFVSFTVVCFEIGQDALWLVIIRDFRFSSLACSVKLYASQSSGMDLPYILVCNFLKVNDMCNANNPSYDYSSSKCQGVLENLLHESLLENLEEIVFTRCPVAIIGTAQLTTLIQHIHERACLQ